MIRGQCMIETTLSRLETAELVRRLSEAEPAYFFNHALVQDMAYASLLKNERKRLHRLIGEMLERTYPDALDENAALLARHYSEAGSDPKIVEFGTCAGDEAARRYAHVEAIEHYRAAVQAALRIQAGRETLVTLVSKLGRMYELQNEPRRALETYAQLPEMARTENEPAYELAGLMLQATLYATPTAVFDPEIGRRLLDRALQLARELEDGAAEARILWNFLLVNGFSGNYRAAVEYGEQSLALADKLNLKTQIAYTLNDLGTYGYSATGESQKARDAMHRARALWRELDILPMLADNLNNSAILEFMSGDYTQAGNLADQALALSERTENIWGKALAHGVRGWVAYETGDYGKALAELQSGYVLACETGSGIQILIGTTLAFLYASLGDVQAGLEVIRVAEGEIEISFYRPPGKAALAYLTWLSGDVDRAKAVLKQAQPRAADEPRFSYLASIVAQGEIGLAQGQAEEVAEYMREVGSQMRAAGLNSFTADAQCYLGRALAELGNEDEARAAFALAEQHALETNSRRALLAIYNHWGLLERANGDAERADALREQGRVLRQSITATTPLKYRAALPSLI